MTGARDAGNVAMETVPRRHGRETKKAGFLVGNPAFLPAFRPENAASAGRPEGGGPARPRRTRPAPVARPGRAERVRRA